MNVEVLAIVLSAVATALSLYVFRATQAVDRVKAVDETTASGFYQYRGFLDGDGVELDGDQITSLRTAKKRAFEKRLQLERDLGAEDGSCEWMGLSRHGASGPYNVIAYNLAEVLTLTGMNCFMGSTSLGAALLHVGDAIVDDWFVCRQWVLSYRESQGISGLSGLGAVPWHRREGEWFALIAALYMDRQWSYEPAQLVIRDSGGRSEVKARVLALADVDRAMLSADACRDVGNLVSSDLGWAMRMLRFRPTRPLAFGVARRWAG